MKRLALIVFSVVLIGCSGSVVRDAEVYKVEVGFMTRAATQQADLLTMFVNRFCHCTENGQFPNDMCLRAAKIVVVVKSRVPWHKDMMLYNGGLIEERPPKEPPAVPDWETLCPKGDPAWLSQTF